MCILLSLHQSILEPIFSEWTEIMELCSLDTASCNSGLRSYFLSMLSLCRINGDGYASRNIKKCYDWLYLRKICLNHLVLNKKLCSSESVKYLLTNRLMSKLSVHVCVESNRLLKSYDLKINTLIVDECFRILELFTLLNQVGPNLEHLDVSRLRDLPEDFGEKIAQLCPKLRTCQTHAYEKVDMLPLFECCPIQSMKYVDFRRLINFEGPSSIINVESASDGSGPVLTIGKGTYSISEALIENNDFRVLERLSPYLGSVKCLTMGCDWSLVFNSLSHCVKLTTLNLVIDLIDDLELGRALRKLVHLRVLVLVKAGLAHETVLQVAENCPLLDDLRIEGNVDITAQLSVLVKGCPRLTCLACDWGMPEDLLLHTAVGLQELTLVHGRDYCSSFQFHEKWLLNFRSYLQLSSGFCTRIIKQNPGLRYVSFDSLDNLTDDSIKLLAKLSPQLLKIGIEKCRGVTAAGLYALEDCQELTMIEYVSAHAVNKLRLKRLLSGRVKLRQLWLSGCSDLCGNELIWIAKNCPLIRELRIKRCLGVENGDIITLLSSCSKLTRLDLNGCANITKGIQSAVHNLEFLNLVDTSFSLDEAQELQDAHDDMDVFW